jgi:hypothetical protein
MPKQHDNRKQTNQYDKIIKENLEVTLPVIIRDILGLDIQVSEELPDDVQHTKERKPDALKKVTDTAGNTYVLQVEFQVEDEKEMVFRMAEYNIMLMRRYQLPVKQYVIFLKDTNPLMPTSLDTEHLKFDFTLIRLAEANYKLFLRSNNPEVKMLGILANFGKQDSYGAVKSIIDGIQSITKGDFAASRYFKQMRIFVQLRSSVEQQFEKAMETVTKFFKEENDFLYRKGEAKGETKGEEKKSHAVVENLIMKLGFTDEQAADVAEVDIDYVKKVRAGLKKK